MDIRPVTTPQLESQLKGLKHARTRSGAVATLLLLLPRIDDHQTQLLGPYVSTLAELLCCDGAGPDGEDDPSMQVSVGAWVAGLCGVNLVPAASASMQNAALKRGGKCIGCWCRPPHVSLHPSLQQANAAAVLGAVASMTDELHAAVDAAAVRGGWLALDGCEEGLDSCSMVHLLLELSDVLRYLLPPARPLKPQTTPQIPHRRRP